MGQEAAKKRTIKISITLAMSNWFDFFPMCLGLSVLPRFTIFPETTHKDKNISNDAGSLGVPGKNLLANAGISRIYKLI